MLKVGEDVKPLELSGTLLAVKSKNDTTTVENSERDGNTRPPDLPLEKPICRSGSNS